MIVGTTLRSEVSLIHLLNSDRSPENISWILRISMHRANKKIAFARIEKFQAMFGNFKIKILPRPNPLVQTQRVYL